MAKTVIIFTPKYYEHNTGLNHPETSKRLKAIMKELESLNLFSPMSGCELARPDLAHMKDLHLVHTPKHVQLVKRLCYYGGGLLDLGDTIVSPESFQVARYAVGGAVKAVDLVSRGEFKNAFALVRPPGHHAGSYYAMGFCIFNNVAVAASHLIGKFHLERVLILDIDAHHGNGIQEIFYDTNKILYISLHEDPRLFPGTGFVDETGEGKGRGYNVNIPFPFRVSDDSYNSAFDEIIVPIVRQYEPQFILMAAGFDGFHGDPVANLRLSASSFASIFEKVLDLASNLCKNRFVAILEGGYNLEYLGKLVALTISRMADFKYSLEDTNPTVSSRAEKQAEKIIGNAKKVQSAFWGLD